MSGSMVDWLRFLLVSCHLLGKFLIFFAINFSEFSQIFTREEKLNIRKVQMITVDWHYKPLSNLNKPAGKSLGYVRRVNM